MASALFRSEALQQQEQRLWGELVLSQPLSLRVLGLSLCLLVAVALALLGSSFYTRKVTVGGRLVPDQGVIEVLAAQRGLLVELLVAPGELVAAGQPLFRLQLDHTLGSSTALTPSLQASLAEQRLQLLQQLQLQQAAQQRSREDAQGQATAVRASLAQLQTMLDVSRRLSALQQQALQRARHLRASGLLAAADEEAVQAKALQQQQASADLVLQQLQLRARLAELQAQQRLADTQASQQAHRLQADLAELDQRMARLGAERDTVQRAPVAARVSSLHVHAGAQVGMDQPVLALLPATAQLRAELQLPSAAVGFAHPGQVVKLRYDAFPYQKFGLHAATLEAVMQSPEPLRQTDTAAWYRAVARLERQGVPAYGRTQPLLAGMQFSAEVVLDTRSLLEWLLEPLFSIRGRS